MLPAVLMMAGTVVSAMGAAQKSGAESDVYSANAAIMRMNAEATKTSGLYEEQKTAREKTQALSKQRALYAKSGVMIDSGSPLLVEADTQTQYQMNINAERYNTATKVQQSLYQADVYDAMASNAKVAGGYNVASTILTGGYSTLKALPVK
jgi:hypothetical protein